MTNKRYLAEIHIKVIIILYQNLINNENSKNEHSKSAYSVIVNCDKNDTVVIHSIMEFNLHFEFTACGCH